MCDHRATLPWFGCVVSCPVHMHLYYNGTVFLLIHEMNFETISTRGGWFIVIGDMVLSKLNYLLMYCFVMLYSSHVYFWYII